MLQQGSNLSDTDRGNLQALLQVVINKYKYDEDHNFLFQASLFTQCACLRLRTYTAHVSHFYTYSLMNLAPNLFKPQLACTATVIMVCLSIATFLPQPATKRC